MSGPFDPRQLEELLGAYALDALDEEEAAAVERYLATDPRARAEVAEHREVATMLAYTGAPAPPGLWDRIAAAIDDDAPPSRLVIAGREGAVRPLPRRAKRTTILAVAASIIAVATAVGLGVASVRLRDEVDRLRGEVAAAPSRGAFAKHVVLRDRSGAAVAEAGIDAAGRGVLLAAELRRLPASRTYQLWGLTPAGAISLGVLGAAPGSASFTVAGRIDGLAITDEVAGGVPVTQQQPIASGSLA